MVSGAVASSRVFHPSNGRWSTAPTAAVVSHLLQLSDHLLPLPCDHPLSPQPGPLHLLVTRVGMWQRNEWPPRVAEWRLPCFISGNSQAVAFRLFHTTKRLAATRPWWKRRSLCRGRTGAPLVIALALASSALVACSRSEPTTPLLPVASTAVSIDPIVPPPSSASTTSTPGHAASARGGDALQAPPRHRLAHRRGRHPR